MLECSWELPAYNLRDIEVKLMWYNGAFGQCPDISPNMTKCTLRPSYAALDVYTWHFRVIVTNTRRNVSAVGPFIAKNQLENVKPDKVDRLNYEYTDNSGCIRLTWTCEAVTCVSPSRKKQIRVRYVTLPGEPKEVHEYPDGYPDRSVLVCDLDPDTLYTFTIDVRATSSSFYSDPVTIAVRTDEDVPLVAPEVHQGAYHRQSFSCLSDPDGYHDVTVYWKKMPKEEARGNIVNYVVETWEANDEMDKRINITGNFTYSMGTSLSGTVRLRCGSAYDIRIRASTKKGFSKSWSHLRIPTFSRQGPRPPSVRVEEGGGKYELTWTDSPRTGQTGYTVFYCQRKNDTHCKGSVMSVDVDSPDRYTTLDVPDTEVEYLFGVSGNFGSFGSGFDLVSCVYHKNAVPPPPSNIAITSKDHAGVIVTWNHVTCLDNAPVIVTYTIRWCKVNKELTTEDETCNGKNVSILAHCPALFVLEDVNEEETYGVQIRSSSSVQTGAFSYPVYITLPKKEIGYVAKTM
ncbi:uncharacterized protein LOC117325314 isoform X2 [Pecten maximus]|uniref:uncharacterized protein LOC117325314 isoform X2 n=1 Tax=Pecten maximus TaxID=6579 RepID=UPI001458AFCE|nr:uncharacterized protein LOC117325314 isoform X2 [Pecten maximus]